MENSIFEKLDKQEESLEDLTSKLDGVSVKDLYALAKRTWDYGDYQTAQKYYNHISLLRPLDWEPPLYASLCNWKGPHKIDFWKYYIREIEKVYFATIDYICDLDMDLEDKEKELKKCFLIIIEDESRTKKMYINSRNDFDKWLPMFKIELAELYYNVFNKINIMNNEHFNEYLTSIADGFLSIVNITQSMPLGVSKDGFDEIYEKSSKEYSSSIYDKKTDDIIYQETEENISIIKTKGAMYFKCYDDIEKKRKYRFGLSCGLLILVFSIVCMCLLIKHLILVEDISFFRIKEITIVELSFYMFLGLLLVIVTLLQKEKIKCNSIFARNRIKNICSSSGEISKYKKFSIFELIIFICSNVGLYFVLLVIIFLAFIQKMEGETWAKAVFFVGNIISAVASFLYYNKGGYKYYNNGKFVYRYQGKEYMFND